MATPQVKHLDHLNMSVENVRESVDWYGRVFGFEMQEEGLYEGRPWAIIRAGEAMLALYEKPGRRAPSTEERTRSRVHGVSHFALRITDRESWERILNHEGLELYWDSPVAWPHSTAWYVHDPSGYEIEVALWEGDEVRFG